MPANTTNLLAGFKEVYESGGEVLLNQQNLFAPMWGKIKKSSLRPSAQGVQNAIVTRGNESGGAINESQGFNTPGNTNPVRATVLAKLNVWPVEITGTAITQSETNVQAFMSTVDLELNQASERLYSDLNRQTYGLGTGQMALLAAPVAAAATITVDQITPFRENQVLDAYAVFGGAPTELAFTVTGVDPATSTITVDRNVTIGAGEILSKTGVFNGAPADGKELAGLRYICNNAAFNNIFEGIDSTVETTWEGNVINAGGVPVSQDLLQRTAARQLVVGGNSANLLISNVGQHRNFLNTELNKVRYAPMDVKAGYETLRWNDKEWMVDKDYPYFEVGMYDTNHLYRFDNHDVKLADFDDQRFRQIPGFDKITAYFRQQGNIGTWKRNAHARLTNLTEPTF